MLVNWTEVEAIANSFLVLTSAGAIGYAGVQLKHEREYRSVANLEKQLATFQSAGFVETRRRLAADRLTEDHEALVPWDVEEPPVSAFEVLDFYEHVGLLVRKGHLDLVDVWHTFYEWAQPVYVDLQRVIEDDDSAYADHYVNLRRVMRQMDDIQLARMHAKNANANHWALWTPERILTHYRYELEVAGHSGRGKRAASRRARLAERAREARVDLEAAALGPEREWLGGEGKVVLSGVRGRELPAAAMDEADARARWERMRHARR